MDAAITTVNPGHSWSIPNYTAATGNSSGTLHLLSSFVYWEGDELQRNIGRLVRTEHDGQATLARPTLWDRILGQVDTLAKPAPPGEEPLDDAAMLRRTRHYLSFNVTELAALLHVERPTIYSWLSGGRIRRANRARIGRIYQLAASWWGLSKEPLGNRLHLRIKGGRSAFEILVEDPIDETAVSTAWVLLSAQSAKVEKPRAELGRVDELAPVPEAARGRVLRRIGRAGRR